ncbi:hypothetical protein L1987_34645 [Smallanthus sonchifolius]|uniref:Uncharacterized protein n=1 Tax=Smallanthus sonchifolius TaxID=185202 RepID=A0ACB9HVN5_9ASTR|nr:hypothetical protein L1987_34645 [Smallanthus sonchifolius]
MGLNLFFLILTYKQPIDLEKIVESIYSCDLIKSGERLKVGQNLYQDFNEALEKHGIDLRVSALVKHTDEL